VASGHEEPHTGWYPLVGVITSAGFESGDRFVCGVWRTSPLGPIADLMWARPDGRRRLVAASEGTAAFVSSVYGFDEVVVDPRFSARLAAARVVAVDSPLLGLRLRARPGRAVPIPLVGPPWVTRYLAGPVARRLLGVETYGVSPTGVQEWYRARWYRPIVEAEASVGGRDLGGLGPLDPRVGFGFSEPPRRPSAVWVRPLLHDPSSAVERALASPAAGRPAAP
jgi:hypothetical protein